MSNQHEDKAAQELRGLFEQLTAKPAVTPQEEKPATVASETAIPPTDKPLPSFDAMEEPFSQVDSETASIASSLILPIDGEEYDEKPAPRKRDMPEEPLPKEPKVKRNPFVALWRAFRRALPGKGDSVPRVVRKVALLMAAVVFLCSAGYLVADMAVLPALNRQQYVRLARVYQADNDNKVTDTAYPKDMLERFAPLYDENEDVRGWLTYRSTDSDPILDIAYPVMYAGDNDTYLMRDFEGNKNRNGSLFFDRNNCIEAGRYSNKSLVIYGNNMANGQMFAGLNKLVGNVNVARAAATLQLSTLFEDDEYKVIGVLLTDDAADSAHYFNPCRTTFSTNGSFMSFVDEVRARSLFDYPVDVIAGDRLLVLSTPVTASVAKLDNARLTVVARRVRTGESASVATTDIVKNTDVVMPYAWYVQQGIALPAYYEKGELPPLHESATTTSTTRTTTTTTVSTETAESDTTAIDPSGSSTAVTGTKASTTGSAATTTGTATTGGSSATVTNTTATHTTATR